MAPSPLTLVIMAAGQSRRFGRLKQLVPVGPGGGALLDYALYDGHRAGFSRFLLIIGPEMQGAFQAHLEPASAAGLDIRFLTQGPRGQPPDAGSGSRDRLRPWGTGVAALLAARHLQGPFAICNADDFYGASAYGGLASALQGTGSRPGGEPDADAFTVVYPLSTTLSDSGGVSRGICRVDRAGRLLGLQEGLSLQRDPGDGQRVRGVSASGQCLNLAGDTWACMNLWGFPRPASAPRSDIAARLEDRFRAFLDTTPGPDREFHLPDAVGELIDRDRIRCRVLPATERWLGVTFPADHARTSKALARVDGYPRHLWPGAATPHREKTGTSWH